MIRKLHHVAEIKIFGYGILTRFLMIMCVMRFYKDIHRMSNMFNGFLANKENCSVQAMTIQ